jgi:hypothetical protein
MGAMRMFEPKATRALAPACVRFLKIEKLGNGPLGFLGFGRIAFEQVYLSMGWIRRKNGLPVGSGCHR